VSHFRNETLFIFIAKSNPLLLMQNKTTTLASSTD